MRKAGYIFLFLPFLFACDSISFKKVALYDKYEEPPPKAKAGTVVFDESVGSMWNSLEDCGTFNITSEAAYNSKYSIKLTWDKSKGCEWLGFGNSYNNWQAVDLSQDRYRQAFSFYARTIEKTAKAIPIVASFEDFGGGANYYFIDTKKYLKGLVVDTSWKQVIVPLWHFPYIEEEFDMYNVKQMKFQLEGAGAFYIDDLKIIEYSKEQYAALRDEVEAMKPKGEMNQVVYREGKLTEDAWGQKGSPCSELSEKTDDSGNQSICWKFDAKDCSWAKWGLNWNDWYQINLRGLEDKAKISFRYKGNKGAGFKVRLECFNYAWAQIFEIPEISDKKWQTVEVPLSELDLKGKNFALDQVKQLLFEGMGSGEIFFDDIKITAE